MDLTGSQFGLLTAIERAAPIPRPDGNRRQTWRCECACGNAITVLHDSLRGGRTKSCGCAQHSNRQSNAVDIAGLRFGRLVVLCRAENSKSGMAMWVVRCDCDPAGERDHAVAGSALRSTVGARSCGCLAAEINSNLHRTHGDSGRSGKRRRAAEYNSWAAMKERCTNPHNASFMLYGGRGITVCSRWAISYEEFLSDMGRKPSPKHSLDRIDTNGDYEPSNCRWATPAEQVRNRRPKFTAEQWDALSQNPTPTTSPARPSVPFAHRVALALLPV